MSDFSDQIPGGKQPRRESKGEAQIRLASWICGVLRGWPFKMKISFFEEDGLADFLGAVNRKWPAVGRWGAPTNDEKP